MLTAFNAYFGLISIEFHGIQSRPVADSHNFIFSKPDFATMQRASRFAVQQPEEFSGSSLAALVIWIPVSMMRAPEARVFDFGRPNPRPN